MTLLKLVLTVPVAYALAYPFLYSGTGGGVFRDVERLGIIGSLVLAGIFLTLIFFYCRDLERSLSLVRPSARTASPRSVWLMFLIPYNFVEDFFIVANVANSLGQEAQHNPSLQGFRGFGRGLGWGWCSAQIASLLPTEVGSVAGIVALPLWMVHWRLVRRVNAELAKLEDWSNFGGLRRCLRQLSLDLLPSRLAKASHELDSVSVRQSAPLYM